MQSSFGRPPASPFDDINPYHDKIPTGLWLRVAEIRKRIRDDYEPIMALYEATMLRTTAQAMSESSDRPEVQSLVEVSNLLLKLATEKSEQGR